MRSYLSYAAMMLLGVTLTVSFYEGRRLVKNTAKALGTTSSVSAVSARRSENEELKERLAEAEDKLARRSTRSADRTERRRASPGRAATTPDDEALEPASDRPAMTRAERIQLMRDRRQRMGEGGGPGGGPLAIRPDLAGAPPIDDPIEEPPELVKDTGTVLPP